MAKKESWIDDRIRDAQEASPNVPTDILDDLSQLLRGKMRERPLTAGELAKLSKDLIEKMATVDALNTETDNED